MAALLIAADPAKNDPAQKDLEKFQGAWVGGSAEMNGDKLSDDDLKTLKLVIKGNRYTVTIGDMSEEGTFKLDPTRNPKAIDLSPSSGANKGKTVKGIYELDGDTHKTCFADPGKPRPKDFTAKAGSGQSNFVMKRTKS
jgi:uncharacterized protein (TIGR03067 family)